MKKGDLIWLSVLTGVILLLTVPGLRELVKETTPMQKYLGGFLKFALLATMGDMLGDRLAGRRWKIPRGAAAKAVLWGFAGMMFTAVFSIYIEGTRLAQQSGILPFGGNTAALAFFSSAVMNTTFTPVMLTVHRFACTYIEEKTKNRSVSLSQIIDRTDWHSLVEFTWVKCCLCFWIPANTVVFMLPAQYMVSVSAALSIVLGVMVAFSKGKARAGLKKPALLLS